MVIFIPLIIIVFIPVSIGVFDIRRFRTELEDMYKNGMRYTLGRVDYKYNTSSISSWIWYTFKVKDKFYHRRSSNAESSLNGMYHKKKGERCLIMYQKQNPSKYSKIHGDVFIKRVEDLQIYKNLRFRYKPWCKELIVVNKNENHSFLDEIDGDLDSWPETDLKEIKRYIFYWRILPVIIIFIIIGFVFLLGPYFHYF